MFVIYLEKNGIHGEEILTIHQINELSIMYFCNNGQVDERKIQTKNILSIFSDIDEGIEFFNDIYETHKDTLSKPQQVS